jgi:methylmalonyl-CoA/ethylmalonyl-CoA epimerase
MNLRAKPVLVAIVTDNCQGVMDSLAKLGIGPWKIYTLDERTISDSLYRGEPHSTAIRVGLAERPDLTWEVIQPLSGTGVHQEHLRIHGESLFHLALDFCDSDFVTRLSELQARGFRIVQSATWLGKAKYAFFEAENRPGLLLETVYMPPGFSMPEPEAWYPAPPGESPDVAGRASALHGANSAEVDQP